MSKVDFHYKASVKTFARLHKSRLTLVFFIILAGLASTTCTQNDEGHMDTEDGDIEASENEYDVNEDINTGDEDIAGDGDIEGKDIDQDVQSDRDRDELEMEEEEEQGPAKIATHFMLGYGETDVTPPLGTILSGYGAFGEDRRSELINDPMLAQAALFANDADQAFLIISLDSGGYGFDFGDYAPGVAELRREISRTLKGTLRIKPEHILIESSHSHGATDHIGFWQGIGEGVSLEVLELTFDGIVAASQEAALDLKEAELFFGSSELEGYSGRDSNCSPVIDNTVSIVQARSPEGEQRVTIINYAKHPTFLPYMDTTMTADFILGLREEMKNKTGAPAMYLQGFIAAVHEGPLSNTIPGDNWLERANAFGKILAGVVLDAEESLVKAEEYDILHRWKDFSCTAEESYLTFMYEYLDMPKRDADIIDEGVRVNHIEVSWHKLGPSEFAVFPGEGTAEYSFALRERMIKPTQFVVGLGNDSIGYILDPESFAADSSGQLAGYEVKMGLGLPAGPCCWDSMEELNWFYGAYQQE